MTGTRGEHDPRYALYLKIGGLDGRPVQILRARHTHLMDRSPDTPRGLFRGPGTSLKHGLVYAFTPAHRVEVDDFLQYGYLREFEEKFQNGEISDYPFFPSGTLVDGVIPFRSDVRPWNYRQFLGDPAAATGFYAIEKAAHVANVPGRGPYGLKYAMADLVPMIAGRLGIADRVAIDLATAHDSPGTAPRYREEARSQPSMLKHVGQILWEIRKELVLLAEQGLAEAEFGFSLDEEVIAGYRVLDEGVSIPTVSGLFLWIPWNALRLGGTKERGVHLLETDAFVRRHHQLDDDAKEIRFTMAPGGVVNAEQMRQRADANKARAPNDVVYCTQLRVEGPCTGRVAIVASRWTFGFCKLRPKA